MEQFLIVSKFKTRPEDIQLLQEIITRKLERIINLELKRIHKRGGNSCRFNCDMV